MLVQLLVIIAAARIAGMVFVRLGQPQVCGEIAAGLILGPSLFGRLDPTLFHMVFSPEVSEIFTMLSQIGLILMMFLIGLEFDFGHLREHGRKAIAISFAGIALPFGLGLLVSWLMYPVVGAGINQLGFALFVATALSITAIPILGRIMLEFNITRSYIGSLTITAAAIDDAAGWTILTVVAAIARSQLQAAETMVMVLKVVAYAAIMLWLVRPLVKRWLARELGGGRPLGLNGLTIVLVLIFLSAIVTSWIGIFAIFGGFMMGAILYDEEAFREAFTSRMRDFTTVFFLPIFFTYTGLRTDVGTMSGLLLWSLCGLVLLAAIVGKYGACAAVARMSGLSWRQSSIVGVMMNTRALMELIVINVGYELGVIPKSVFFMLVFMAVVTTYMTAPILRRLIRTTELEPLYATSPFAQARAALSAVR